MKSRTRTWGRVGNQLARGIAHNPRADADGTAHTNSSTRAERTARLTAMLASDDRTVKGQTDLRLS